MPSGSTVYDIVDEAELKRGKQVLPREFYIFPEDLYRVGNSSGPRLDRIRPDEVDSIEINGIRVIFANNRGISLFTDAGIRLGSVSGWAWKIGKTTPIPLGLKLHQDTPEHYMLCPIRQMPLDEYKGLLSRLLVHCKKVFKVEKVRR